MVYKCFNKTSYGGAIIRTLSETLTTQDKSTNKSQIMSNQHLAEELHKPIIKKFENRKVH